MKIFIFLLLSFVIYNYTLNIDDKYESIVKDIYISGNEIIWNAKYGDINFYRLTIFKYYENKEIEIKLQYPIEYYKIDEDNPCSNYSLIFINNNFTYSAQKSDIINNENYINASLSCHYEQKIYPNTGSYYISIRYKVGKINSSILHEYNVIGIKTQTFLETSFYYLTISEVKEEKEKEDSFFSKHGTKITVIVIIVNLILMGIGKALQKKKKDPIEDIKDNNRNDNSQNFTLLPQ
mgnify:CR=1 FL=1